MGLQLEDLTILWLMRCDEREQLAEGLRLLQGSPQTFPALEEKVRRRLEALEGVEGVRRRLDELERALGGEEPAVLLERLKEVSDQFGDEMRRAEPALEAKLQSLLSFALCTVDRDEEALLVATRGVQLATDPQVLVPLLLQRALSLEKLGRSAEAWADYRRVLAVDPANEMAATVLSEPGTHRVSAGVRLFAVQGSAGPPAAECGCGGPEEAEQTADEAPELPSLPEEEQEEARRLFEQGRMLFLARDYPASMEAYNDALALAESEEVLQDVWTRSFIAATLSNRALTAFHLGEFDRGHTDACRAHALEPSHSRLYRKAINLSAALTGVCGGLLGSGRWDEMRGRQAVKAQKGLGELLGMTRELLREDGGNAAVREMSSKAEELLGKLDGALRGAECPTEVPKPNLASTDPCEAPQPLPSFTAFTAHIRGLRSNPRAVAAYLHSLPADLLARHFPAKQPDFFLLQSVLEALTGDEGQLLPPEFALEGLRGLAGMRGAGLLARMLTGEERERLRAGLERLATRLPAHNLDDLRRFLASTR